MRKFYVLSIVVNTPLITEFEYRWNVEDGNKIIPKIGQFALVPFGRRKMLGLIVKIKNKSVLGAGLDVLEYEENSFEKINNNNCMSFLNNAKNVLLTPHIAGLSIESKKKLSEILANKILDFIKSIK